MSDMPPPPPDDWGHPPPPDDSGWPSQPPTPPQPAEPSLVGGVPGARLAYLGTGETVALASPGTRFTARIADLVILAVLGSVLEAVLGAVAFSAGAIVVAAVYETVFIATKGQTPGKMATRIRIVRADDGAMPGWGAAAARWALPAVGSVASEIVWAVGVESDAMALLGVVSLLVYVSLVWDKRRQGWHDMVARTFVINTPTQTALSNRVAMWLGIALVVLLVLLVVLIIEGFRSFG